MRSSTWPTTRTRWVRASPCWTPSSNRWEPHGEKPGRYPFPYAGPLNEAIAKKWNVKPENVLVGAGSTQILVNATHTYTSNERALVGSLPTYEECFGYASLAGHKTKAVPLTSEYKMDLDQTYYACKGAGMLFYCNPNNPVASLVDPAAGEEFLTRVMKMNKDLRILVDEAYIDYVTTPGHKTMIPKAVENPRLIVAQDVLEGVRHGRAPHRLRDCARGHHQRAPEVPHGQLGVERELRRCDRGASA